MILDTNAVSALFGGNPRLEKKLAGATKHHLPVIVLGEYRYALIGSRQRAELELLLQALEQESFILYPDRETASHYAQVRHQLKVDGQPIPENDIWIAALARQHQLDILSQDRHFDQVKGIRRTGW